MAFRDDREALHHKARALEDRLEEAKSELEEKDAALQRKADEIRRLRRGSPGAMRKRKGLAFVFASLLAAGASFGALIFLEESGKAPGSVETLAAQVDSVTGDAPVEAGTICEVEAAVRTGERPPLLGAMEGCELFVGESLAGNDPVARVNLRLCGDAADDASVSGDMQWSSLAAGWSVRSLSGRWDGDRLRLVESEVTESHPNSGYGFCPVSEYGLTRGANGRLRGTFRSEECHDEGSVSLRPIDPQIFRPPAGSIVDCSVAIRCGPTTVYGAERPSGIDHCVADDDRIVTVRDPTAEDGDPSLDLDTRTGRIRVGATTWGAELAIVR